MPGGESEMEFIRPPGSRLDSPRSNTNDTSLTSATARQPGRDIEGSRFPALRSSTYSGSTNSGSTNSGSTYSGSTYSGSTYSYSTYGGPTYSYTAYPGPAHRGQEDRPHLGRTVVVQPPTGPIYDPPRETGDTSVLGNRDDTSHRHARNGFGTPWSFRSWPTTEAEGPGKSVDDVESPQPIKFPLKLLAAKIRDLQQSAVENHAASDLRVVLGDCRLADFISEEREDSFDEFCKLLTVTSTEVRRELRHYATSCGRYLESAWPNLGTSILERLWRSVREQAENNLPIFGRSATQSKEAPLLYLKVDWDPLHSSGPEITIKAASLETRIQVCEQLGWLASVLRPSSYSPVAYAQFGLESERSSSSNFLPTLKFATAESVESTAPDESSCWKSLFFGTSIAYGFPVPHEDDEDLLPSGLELPFEVMVKLADIKYPLVYNKGIVLRGPRSLMYPVKIAKQRAIFWHLFQPSHYKDLTLEDITKHMKTVNWSKTLDFSEITMSTAVLGYASRALVYAGTKESGFSSIKRSEARSEKSSMVVQSFSVSLGSEGMGIFGGNVGAAVKLTKPLRSNIQVSMISDQDRLWKSMKHRSLLYDEPTSRGWLVPEICVVLQCLQSWASQRGKLDDIPFPEPSSVPGLASYCAINESASTVLHYQNDGKPFTLIDQAKVFLNILQQRKEDAMLRSQQELPGLIGKSKLYLWEYTGLVNMDYSLGRKRLELPKNRFHPANPVRSWLPLILENPEVLPIIGSGFKELIRPEPSAGICSKCAQVPSHSGVLTSTISCLRSLLSPVSKDAKFSDIPTPFQSCFDARKPLSGRVQDLTSLGNGLVAHPGIESGAVILKGLVPVRETEPCDCAMTSPRPNSPQAEVPQRDRKGKGRLAWANGMRMGDLEQVLKPHSLLQNEVSPAGPATSRPDGNAEGVIQSMNNRGVRR